MKRDLIRYNKAIIFRQSGKSIKYIARELKISSSTASIWCREVALSPEQKQVLNKNGMRAEILRGFAKKRHQDKLDRHNNILTSSRAEINGMNGRELFLVGLALYWAEGFKSVSEGRVGFCNSDPKMIELIMRWFRTPLNIPNENFILRAEFNSSHQNREEEIRRYWSGITGISMDQFNKSYVHKSSWSRDYSHKSTYYGVLRIRVRKSLNLLLQIKGWIEGLSESS